MNISAINPKIIVLIPCYNEEKNIPKVIAAIKKSTQDMDIDYIIINDCSKDKTIELCKRNEYNYLNLPVNLGIGGCVQAGYKYAYIKGYDIAIQHDGDGQHDPIYFKDVINPIINNEADIVIGSRFMEKEGFQSTLSRRIGIRFLSGLIKIYSKNTIKDVTSGYRAVNKRFIKIYANKYAQDYPEPEAIVEALCYKARIKEVPVKMKEREEGKSSIVSWKALYYMVKVSIAILFYMFIFKQGEE